MQIKNLLIELPITIIIIETYVLRSTDGGKIYNISEKSPFDYSDVERELGGAVIGNMKVSSDGGNHVIAII